MVVSVKLLQTRSVQSTVYRVNNSITTSSGISKKIFVKRESTAEFDRVAAVSDMLNVTEDPTPLDGYYRDDSCYKDFVDVSDADTFATHVKDRIEWLVNEYNDSVNEFVGSEYTNFASN